MISLPNHSKAHSIVLQNGRTSQNEELLICLYAHFLPTFEHCILSYIPDKDVRIYRLCREIYCLDFVIK